MNQTQAPNAIDEPDTPQELGKLRKLHPDTIIKLFVNEPDVIRFGSGARTDKRRYFTLRIPKHVAERVFNRFRVKASA